MSEKHETSVTLEVGPPEFNALIVALQLLLEGPLVVFQSEGVQGLCHSLLHLLHILKTAAPELLFQSSEHQKVTRGHIWTAGRVRDGFGPHLCQVVCHHDGLVGGCVILVEVPLARFEEYWPLAAKSLPKLPQNLHVMLLVDHLALGGPS